MRYPTVTAPLSLLLDPKLTAATKVLWLALRAASPLVTLTGLGAAAALTNATVRTALTNLVDAGYCSPTLEILERSTSTPGAEIPVSLLADRRVRSQAKLLYGTLQIWPTEQFTYKELHTKARIALGTTKDCIWELADAGWLWLKQANQLAPVRFSLRVPEQDQGTAEVEAAKQRLAEADYRGEQIMREYLSLLIDSDEFEDNARPGFLVNPLTDERLELDRYYPPIMGFEYHGEQHFRTTKRYPSERALAMRKARDLMKEALCARRGLPLIVVTASNLGLEYLRQSIAGRLPMRDLSGHCELVQYLEKVSNRNRASSATPH